MYNKTQLNPEVAFEKHIFHRDQFAHYLRWTHALKIAKIGMNILDIGCGSGNMLEVFYRNRYKPNVYQGIDVRSKMICKCKEKWKDLKFAYFESTDICETYIKPLENQWDIITCFEVLEHLGKENAEAALKNIAHSADENTIILISTPNYDEQVGAANNHMIDGKVGEFKHEELQELLEKYFVITAKYGTFASQKDYKHKMNDWQKEMFNNLSDYYDSNLISVLLAPMFPKEARNCLWKLKKKSL